MKITISTSLFIFLIGVAGAGCSSAPKPSHKNPKKEIARIELPKDGKITLLAESYRLSGKQETFLINEKGESTLNYELVFPDQSILPLEIVTSNMEVRVLSEEKFSQDQETLPVWFATSYGDCDELEESFSIVKAAGSSTFSVKHFKWMVHGKGQCSGNKKTDCSLALVSQDVFDLKDKTLVSHDENLSDHKKRNWYFSGDRACSKSALKGWIDQNQ